MSAEDGCSLGGTARLFDELHMILLLVQLQAFRCSSEGFLSHLKGADDETFACHHSHAAGFYGTQA